MPSDQTVATLSTAGTITAAARRWTRIAKEEAEKSQE